MSREHGEPGPSAHRPEWDLGAKQLKSLGRWGTSQEIISQCSECPVPAPAVKNFWTEKQGNQMRGGGGPCHLPGKESDPQSIQRKVRLGLFLPGPQFPCLGRQGLDVESGVSSSEGIISYVVSKSQAPLSPSPIVPAVVSPPHSFIHSCIFYIARGCTQAHRHEACSSGGTRGDRESYLLGLISMTSLRRQGRAGLWLGASLSN